MNSKERRYYILRQLEVKKEPLKGQSLAGELGVTRQVIVKDIAILRAEGKNIIATPDGYIIPAKEENKVQRVIALCHKSDDIEDELSTIVKFGGMIRDVIIEHPVYGEIRGMLMIKTLYDAQNFVENFKKFKAEPLSSLTGGVHIHTIEASSSIELDKIVEELNAKGYLVCD